jgi:ABC-type polysaccharide/polyol phosphate transport system ATPase subunit
MSKTAALKNIVSVREVAKGYSAPNQPGSVAVNALLGRPTKIWHQALDNVSFDIACGENVGFLGRNGAGKSTLLSLVAGAMIPDAGDIKINGRIAAVLSLGRGLDPQLSGRENTILFARTLGATRAEITAVLDDIKQFSELGEVFDAPMRTYSSGMRARLAFSTAFHVKSDLMILDETLAVGDLSFRFKCYEALAARRDARGVALMIVSHNPMTLSRFCERIIIIDEGKVVFDGESSEGLITYKQICLKAEEGLDHQSNQAVAELEAREETGITLRVSDSVWTFALRLKCNEACGPLTLRVGLADHTGVTLTAQSLLIENPKGRDWTLGETLNFDVSMDPILKAGKGRFSATLSVKEDGKLRPIFHNPKLISWRVAGKIVPGQIVNLEAK